MFGFHGRYCRYDLSSGSGEPIAIPETVLRRYLGGVGLGAWLLEREGHAGQDPLAPRVDVARAAPGAGAEPAERRHALERSARL